MAEAKRLLTLGADKKVGGVCSGFANYFDMDPSAVRLLFVLIVLATGIFPALIFYLIAWAVMPEPGQ